MKTTRMVLTGILPVSAQMADILPLVVLMEEYSFGMCLLKS
jgi:hypothetical protein